MAGENTAAEKGTEAEVLAMKRKSLLSFFFCTALICLLFSPVTAETNEEVSIRYAKGFQAQKKGQYTLVEVSNPWPGADISFRYLLKARGSATPLGYKGYQVVEVPIHHFVSLSTTFIAYIEQLGLVDRLIGFSNFSRIHSKAILDGAAQKKIVEVGQGGNLQVETLLDLEPDMIFSFASGSFRDAHPKLLEAGLRVGVIGEYMESHPLGCSEWIKFVGLFTGKEKEAEEIFNRLEKKYLYLAGLTAGLVHRPTVVTGTPFNGRWYVAGGESYVGQYLHDAGADYVFRETTYTGSKPMDIELVYERGQDADFWINTGFWKTLNQAGEADPRFQEFKSLGNGLLYNNNRRVNERGGNDYWESGIMAPDVILADLIRIFHSDLLPHHQLVYYTRLK